MVQWCARGGRRIVRCAPHRTVYNYPDLPVSTRKGHTMSTRQRATTAATRPRPTPLNPYPHAHASEEQGDEKAYPPELGTDSIAILEGRTFMCSNALGDVPSGSVGG